VVKKQMTAIRNCKGVEMRLTHYQKLINYTLTTVSAVKDVLLSHEHWQDWVAQPEHDLPLIERMIDQAERRVVNGEKVLAEGKLVSLFEAHTEIIVKDKPQVQYGHKINLSSGKQHDSGDRD
jgi:IS5 family transposase